MPPEIWPPGRVVGDSYRIRHRLGFGGMGQVYLAYDEATHREVAVKVPYDSHAGDARESLARWRNNPRARRQLTEEIRRWMGLIHPHMVQAFDVMDDQTTDYLPAIFMDYCEGGSLAALLRQEAHRPKWPDLLDVAVQVCWAMQYAHKAGMIHRDLKPANVLLGGEGVAKVSDFGLAKALESGGVKVDTSRASGLIDVSGMSGTPPYMAPEQWRGQAGPASDVYAFGVMLYEMFTGQRPFAARSLEEMRRLHAKARVRDPSKSEPGLPRRLADTIVRCLAKSPRKRPGSFEVLAKELTSCCRELTGESYGRAKPSAVEVTRERKLSQAWSLVRLSRGCMRRGDWGDAMARFRQTQQIFEELGDRIGLSTCLGNQAVILRDWGRLEEAMRLHKEEEGICRELDDRAGLSICLGNQAVILAHDWGRPEEAMGLHKEEEGICRELGKRDGLSCSLGNQAMILHGWGRLEEAMGLLEQAERIYRELRDQVRLSICLGNQAVILRDWGRLEEAMGLFKEEEGICRELGDRAGLSICLGNQAVILRDWGGLEEAMGLHKEEEGICRELDDRAGLSRSLGNQAAILRGWGRPEEAMGLLKEAEGICRELGLARAVSPVRHRRGLLIQPGRLEEAMAAAKELEQLSLELNNKTSLADALALQGMILKERGRFRESGRLYDAVERLCRELGDNKKLALILHQRAELASACNRPEEATKLHQAADLISLETEDEGAGG